MQRRVHQFICSEKLVSAGDTVVVGVSGGPDSLCLLHLLNVFRAGWDIHLHVAHLNHSIRGADADTDARFVADFAGRQDLPCTVEKRDVPAIARRQKLAIEEAARCTRYAFLLQVARRIGASRIAVGHNADDQSETIVMHWLRGAGLAGLRGMLPATRMADLRLISPPPVQADGNRPASDRTKGDDVWLIRPLLETPRAEIEQYCARHNLEPRFDRSNLDTTLFRNKLRHELLPTLEQAYRPNFRAILRRSAKVIRDDYDLLCRLRDEAWQSVVVQVSDQAVVLNKPSWQECHPSLQRAIVRQAVQKLRWNLRDVTFEHVEAAMRVAQQGRVGTQATLPRDVILTVGYRQLYLADAGFVPAPDFPALQERIRIDVPGSTALPGGWHVEAKIVPRDQVSGWERNRDAWCAYLDGDVLGAQLVLRRRRDGDSFCPLGMKGHKKLVNELLVNEKVPAWWRDSVPLLVRQDDGIMWVCGWRIDERARIGDQTSRVAVIRFTRHR